MSNHPDVAAGSNKIGPSKQEKDEISSKGDLINHFMKLSLGKNEETIPAVLKEPTIDAIIEYIKSGACKNIITLAGAGISTSAGIPDFRSSGTGIYDNLSQYDLPQPDAIFDIDYFKINPKPFFTLAKQLLPTELRPTLCHHFIRLLSEKNILLRHYTQNIDTLEHVAGIPNEKIVEAHGTFRTSHCMDCSKEFKLDYMKEKILSENIPLCDGCNGVVKPDVIFFGEILPEKFFSHIETDFEKCDLLIVMGTSLCVEPFSSLVDSVSSTCPRLLINKEEVESNISSYVEGIMEGQRQGFSIGMPGNQRDVGLFGDCDDGCKSLAQKLGWKDQLDALTFLKKDHKL